jgi:hypothetical protein
MEKLAVSLLAGQVLENIRTVGRGLCAEIQYCAHSSNVTADALGSSIVVVSCKAVLPHLKQPSRQLRDMK